MSIRGAEGIVVAAILVLGLAGMAQGETILTVTDLGTLGGASSLAYGLNANGDVVGSYTTAGGVQKAFIWHDINGNRLVNTGEMQDLGTLGGTDSCALGINDSGQVTGWAYKSTGNETAFIWTDANHDWKNQTGEMASLGTLGGATSRGYGINNAGMVAGLSYSDATHRWGIRWVDGDGDWKYDAGEMVNLGALGGTQSRAYGLNTLGRTVGYATDSAVKQQSFRWIDANGNKVVNAGELTALASPEVPSFAWDINDSGVIAGYFTTASGKNHAFYSDGTTVYDVNGVIGGQSSEAYSIDEAGTMSGSYVTATGETRAFVFDTTAGTFSDLTNMLTPGLGWVLTSARGINNDMAVGWGTINGQQHAFIVYSSEVAPAPEPMTLVLLGTGAVVILRRRRS